LALDDDGNPISAGLASYNEAINIGRNTRALANQAVALGSGATDFTAGVSLDGS
jgi:hypothetical protein